MLGAADQRSNEDPAQAREIWDNHCQRWEDFRVLHLEALRRLINVVLIAALFLLNLRLYVERQPIRSYWFWGANWG